MRDLLRAGRLRPAVKARVGGTGHARWLVDAAAVAAYRAPRHHHGGRPAAAPPPGYVSVPAFRDATGLANATLHRRLAAGAVASVAVGRRRWIPETELARVAGGRDRGTEH